VPAAAVIQTVQVLFVFIGRKGYVGGFLNLAWNAGVKTLEQGFDIF
jgi:hypothetical protein